MNELRLFLPCAAGVEEFLIDRLGDAKAAGRVLAIDDDEIE